jgi:alkaline phosphatase D
MSARETSTRREFVRTSTLAGAGLALGGAVPGWARKAPPGLTRGGKFTQSVCSGMPGRHGAILWTRVDELEERATLRLEVAADRGFRNVIHSEKVSSRPGADQTVEARVSSKKLKPDERYFYRFETATRQSPVGRFQTLPGPGSTRPLRIGFWGCQCYTEGLWPAHRGLVDEDVDLMICLGDYIYEYPRGVSHVRDDESGVPEPARSLEDYRRKYRFYRSDPLLQGVHENHAMMFLWDDHEVANNYWREGQSADVQPGFEERRANGYRAWFEHMPVAPFRQGSSRIYRSVATGGLADLFFIDDRQYRDPQPCGDSFLVPCAEKDEPGRKLLGDRQKAWLKEKMKASEAPWKVLVNGVMLMAQDLPAPGSTAWVDTWDGYGAERRELVNFWIRNEIRDVIVMTGDDHNNWAGTVTTTGHVDGEPGAVEFVVPSISSDNNTEYLGGNPAVGLIGENLARTSNPHVTMVDFFRHGYCVLELDRRKARVLFRHVESKLDPKSPTSTTYRFEVPRGRIEVNEA